MYIEVFNFILEEGGGVPRFSQTLGGGRGAPDQIWPNAIWRWQIEPLQNQKPSA